MDSIALRIIAAVALMLPLIGCRCSQCCVNNGYRDSSMMAYVPFYDAHYRASLAMNAGAFTGLRQNLRGPTLATGCRSCNVCQSGGATLRTHYPVIPISVALPPEILSSDTPGSGVLQTMPPVNDEVSLGRMLYFNETLSSPDGQSCASCHSPAAGFADPNHSLAVSRGALSDRVGSRNAPTAAYASFSPPLHYDATNDTYVGGLFWDGRAKTLSEQAKGPLLNHLEMNNSDGNMVVAEFRKTKAAADFKRIHGVGSLDDLNSERAYDRMADAIAAFERSVDVNSFTSKYDSFLMHRASLTAVEAKGLDLFNGKANCAACHPSTVVGNEPGPLFTDFTYDNVGIPKNEENPFLALSLDLNPEGRGFIDHGLATTVAKIDPSRAEAQDGKFKVPTLRNVEHTAPYGHNGFFRTLKDIVHFYNTRDLEKSAWPIAEIPETVNHEELGDLQLSEEDENAIVAFLLTLTDGYQLPTQ